MVDLIAHLALGRVALAHSAGFNFRTYDEPEGHLDTARKERLVELLREEAASRGIVILLTSHDAEVEAMMDDFINVERIGNESRIVC